MHSMQQNEVMLMVVGGALHVMILLTSIYGAIACCRHCSSPQLLEPYDWMTVNLPTQASFVHGGHVIVLYYLDKCCILFIGPLPGPYSKWHFRT
jgi:hypothetical protein